MTIKIKVIKPPALKGKAFRLAARRELIKVGGEVVVDFRRVVRSWNGERPDFVHRTSEEGGDRVILFAGVEDFETKGGKKFMWLNDGTRVRYAHMTPDFRPKTIPRVLNSFAGAGGLMRVDKTKPLPGIKAREWDKEAEDKWRPLITTRVEAAVGAAIAEAQKGTP